MSSLRKKHPREYESWQNMKGRCYCKKRPNYHRYGGRGITVCEQWLHSFNTFLRDMGIRPSDCKSIDRLDNNGNYEPNNCRWATAKEQAFNRSTMTDETKHKISMSKIGEKNPFWGKKHSSKTKQEWSKKRSGAGNVRYGKSVSEETRQRISMGRRRAEKQN